MHRPDARAGGLRSNLGPFKSDTVLPMASHRCDIPSKGAVLLGCNDVEMDPPTRYTLRRSSASKMKHTKQIAV